MNKPVYPYAPGQIFKNRGYRKYGSAYTTWQHRLRYGLGIKNPPKMVASSFLGGLSFGWRGNYSATILSREAGLPVHPKLTSALFENLEPCGYVSEGASNSLFAALLEVPMVQFTVLKATTSSVGGARKLKAGNYISVGRSEGDSETGLEVVKLGNQPNSSRCTRLCPYEYFKKTCYDMCDIFLPSSMYSSNPDLFLLPSSSFVWFWKDDRWIPGRVSVSKASNRGKNIKLEILEIQGPDKHYVSGDLLFQTSGPELKVHRKISKMIRADQIRVAARSFTVLAKSQSAPNFGAEIVRLLVRDYQLPVLESYKMRMLKSTAYKTCASFEAFVEAYKTVNAKPLQPSCSSYINYVAKHVYRAAVEGTPLFWGSDTMDQLEGTNSNDLAKACGLNTEKPAWIQSCSLYNMERYFGLSHKEVDHQSGKYKVQFTVVESQPVVKVSIRKTRTPHEFLVPKMVQDRGQDFVQKYLEARVKEAVSSHSNVSYRRTIDIEAPVEEQVKISNSGNSEFELQKLTTIEKVNV